MFWLPRKTIYTGPKKQRGNICFQVGLPPQRLVDVNGDYVDDGTPSGGGGWTLIQEWDTNAGDMVTIDAAFNLNARGQGFYWNVAGTLLTLCSATDDTIRTFACSTPYDPDTATQVNGRAVVNPQGLHWNAAGTLLFCHVIVGDRIDAIPGSGFVVGNGAVVSDITKADVGHGGPGDGSKVMTLSADFMLWEGDGDIIKRISTPGGNLDAFAVQATEPMTGGTGNLVIGTSPLTLDNKSYCRGVGAPGVEFVTMDDALDVATINYSVAQSLSGLTSMRPVYLWFDPNDTSEIWTQGDLSGGMQLARFATNVPSL